ncbi:MULTISPECIES: hypothetical protein [Fischerella]|uniref:hypothetical protein n=1 Tax=Fischerella TaxID=1190 RepID=UPI000318F273|nr:MULTISPECIES: hypothetical protein [Fischerella]
MYTRANQPVNTILEFLLGNFERSLPNTHRNTYSHQLENFWLQLHPQTLNILTSNLNVLALSLNFLTSNLNVLA